MGDEAKDFASDRIDDGYNDIGILVYEKYFYDYINIKGDKNEYLKDKGIQNIDFSSSKISKDEIYINITYQIRNELPIDFIGSMNISEGVYIKTFAEGESLYALSNNIERIELDYDVWELNNLERGKKIAEILGNNLGYMYYGIDKLENDALESIVSVDTRKKTYLTQENLYDRAKEKIDELYEFREGNKNGKIVTKSDYNRKLINLALPSEELTNSQEAQLESARRYARERNILFKITIIEKQRKE